jgi:hypothetical protein
MHISGGNHMTRMKLTIVVLLAIALVAACGDGAATPAARSTAEKAAAKATAPAAQAKAPTGSAGLALFEQTMRAQLATKAWRSELTTDDAGKISQTTTEYVAPDRLHLADSVVGEIIVIGDGAFRRKPGGAWEALPAGMGAAFRSALDPQKVDELLKSVEVSSFKFVGAELLDGRPTWVYDYNTSMKTGDTTVNGKSRVWIGVADKLPYKTTVESNSLSTPGGQTKQTQIYSYPSEIKIEAPM